MNFKLITKIYTNREFDSKEERIALSVCKITNTVREC